jgi:hypothetical protein
MSRLILERDLMWKGNNMLLLPFLYQHGLIDLHIFGDNFYGVVHFSSSLYVHKS